MHPTILYDLLYNTTGAGLHRAKDNDYPVTIHLLFRKESDELNLEKYFTFTEYADKEEVEHIRSGLSFDAKLFKANKEVGCYHYYC